MNSSGSKSMACNESKRVNVGDPGRSQKDRVLVNKTQPRGHRKAYLTPGSQMCRSTCEAMETSWREGRWVNMI